MPNVKLDKRWVCIEKYPKLLASCGFDIGIAPLETNRFNAGKSNLKYLELAVLGIPGVFTDFDPYKSVKQGKTGYKALKTDEWIDCLSKLIESPDLRKNMGIEARKHVLKDFNIKDTTKRYMDLIRGL
jgi:glycosyltransferase involved in cell wall biosynthesis